MTNRLVIPKEAKVSDTAFQGMSWQQVADLNRVDGIAVLGDQWCIDNHVSGLGIAEAYITPLAPGPVLPTTEDKLSNFKVALVSAVTIGDIAVAAEENL